MATQSDNRQIEVAEMTEAAKALASLENIAIKIHTRKIVHLTNSHNEIMSSIDRLTAQLKSTHSQTSSIATDQLTEDDNETKNLNILVITIVTACTNNPTLITRFIEMLRESFPEIYKLCIDAGVSPIPKTSVGSVCALIPAPVKMSDEHKRLMLTSIIETDCFKAMHIDALLSTNDRDAMSDKLREEFKRIGPDLQIEHIKRRVQDKKFAAVGEWINICTTDVMSKLDADQYEY